MEKSVLKNLDIRKIYNFITNKEFQKGANKRYLCPFCGEIKHNFVLNKDNTYYCFACSNKPKDTFEFVQELQKCNYGTAKDYLTANYENIQNCEILDLSSFDGEIIQHTTEPTTINPEQRKIIYKAFFDVCGKWISKDCETYLYDRGIKRYEIEKYKLFSVTDYMNTAFFLLDNFKIDVLIASGLFSKNTNKLIYGIDRVLIPYFGVNNEIVFFEGRTIKEVTEKNPKMVNVGQKNVYNLNNIHSNNSSTVVCLEGVFDCISFEILNDINYLQKTENSLYSVLSTGTWLITQKNLELIANTMKTAKKDSFHFIFDSDILKQTAFEAKLIEYDKFFSDNSIVFTYEILQPTANNQKNDYNELLKNYIKKL